MILSVAGHIETPRAFNVTNRDSVSHQSPTLMMSH
jgi:hypothetical protein